MKAFKSGWQTIQRATMRTWCKAALTVIRNIMSNRATSADHISTIIVKLWAATLLTTHQSASPLHEATLLNTRCLTDRRIHTRKPPTFELTNLATTRAAQTLVATTSLKDNITSMKVQDSTNQICNINSKRNKGTTRITPSSTSTRATTDDFQTSVAITRLTVTKMNIITAGKAATGKAVHVKLTTRNGVEPMENSSRRSLRWGLSSRWWMTIGVPRKTIERTWDRAKPTIDEAVKMRAVTCATTKRWADASTNAEKRTPNKATKICRPRRWIPPTGTDDKRNSQLKLEATWEQSVLPPSGTWKRSVNLYPVIRMFRTVTRCRWSLPRSHPCTIAWKYLLIIRVRLVSQPLLRKARVSTMLRTNRRRKTFQRRLEVNP